MSIGVFPQKRLRRLRQKSFVRNLVQENNLLVTDLICPFFVLEGKQQREPIESMPEVYRFSIDLLLEEIKAIVDLGIVAIILFPVIGDDKKTIDAAESFNSDGLVQRAVRSIKVRFPSLGVITDVALDPFTLHGHDGIVNAATGVIDNDITVDILVRQALSHVFAGADIVAPSDMMDGRVLAIRNSFEKAGLVEALILSYSAKYASSYYGPFRRAIDTCNGANIDKSSYQINCANITEAYNEVVLDDLEGADIVMVKPAMPYLDVIHMVKQSVKIPVFAYQVSGEYSMQQAAFQNSWLDKEKVVLESLLSIKRAGANAVITYFAKYIAQML